MRWCKFLTDLGKENFLARTGLRESHVRDVRHAPRILNLVRRGRHKLRLRVELEVLPAATFTAA